MKKKPLPSAEELRRLFNYNPETGILSHALPKRGGVRAGDKAGSVNSDGYISVGVNYQRFYAQRIIWKMQTGLDPVNTIDHKDNDRSNNRWSNLREADVFEQNHNRKRGCDNTSGYKGVCFHKRLGRWRAAIRVNGQGIRHLGLFQNPAEAHAAYVAAATELYGEFTNAG